MARAPRAATLQKGHLRVEEVLTAAEDLLKRQGAEGLSVRAVAQRVGISVGNLQYYFPTRASLLDAVFQRYADSFRDDLERTVMVSDDPREDLVRLVDYWLDTEHLPEQALFWHLWAISAYDESARDTMTRVYGSLIDRITVLLQHVHEGLATDEAALRAATMTSVIEGSGLFVGFGRKPARKLRGLQGEIRSIVLELIDRPPRSATKPAKRPRAKADGS
jgi:AcrR family transcriptional regulator